jgi:hypothetical protein
MLWRWEHERTAAALSPASAGALSIGRGGYQTNSRDHSFGEMARSFRRWGISASHPRNLRAVEAQAFSIRLRRILDEEEPFLPLFNNRKWMEDHYNPGEPPERILAEFIALRSEELAWLKNVSSQDWNRTGRHPWWGLRALQWWVEQILRFSEEQLQRLHAANSE